MTKFKVDDRVVKARPFTNVKYCAYGGDDTEVSIGTEGFVRTVICDEELQVIFDNGTSWKVDQSELDLVKGYKAKPVKPIDKHLVVQDSCGNMEAIRDSYDEAEEYAKGKNWDATIYKMTEVAKVTNERKVTKVRAKKATTTKK